MPGRISLPAFPIPRGDLSSAVNRSRERAPSSAAERLGWECLNSLSAGFFRAHCDWFYRDLGNLRFCVCRGLIKSPTARGLGRTAGEAGRYQSPIRNFPSAESEEPRFIAFRQPLSFVVDVMIGETDDESRDLAIGPNNYSCHYPLYCADRPRRWQACRRAGNGDRRYCSSSPASASGHEATVGAL
jgi:hypothetical protein